MEQLIRFPKLGITLTLNTVAFEFGGFEVYWYGVIIAAGFLLAALYAMKSSPKFNLNPDHVFDAVFIGLIAGVIGARIYYVLFYPGDKYWQDPVSILDIRDGGLGIYGGIIAGLGAAVLVAKWRKMKIGAILDIGALGFLIGQGVGRWANFVNQEAFGDATTLPWGMRSEQTELVVEYGSVHPCFFYESMLCLIGFIFLHIFSRKFRQYDGQVFLLYIVWYGISRFIVEGLRTDSLMIFGLKVSQVVAVISIIAGIAMLVKFRKSTALTGSGNKAIMIANDITLTKYVKVKEKKVEELTQEDINLEESTVFSGEKYLFNPSENDRVIHNKFIEEAKNANELDAELEDFDDEDFDDEDFDDEDFDDEDFDDEDFDDEDLEDEDFIEEKKEN